MMRMNNIQMKTLVPRQKLLEVLRGNLERHAAIVREAREGYVRRARAALEERLAQVLQGKVVTLAFTLAPPLDYSEVYRNSIEMLEWGTEEAVELAADEFRQLVRDEWDWTETFMHSNSAYSRRATSWLEGAGASVEPPVGNDAPAGAAKS